MTSIKQLAKSTTSAGAGISKRKAVRAPASSQEPAPNLTPKPGDAPKSKLGAMVALLRRSEGASLPELMSATGWQAHSVRGAMSGTLKKKLGLEILSEKTEAGRLYRTGETQR